ncbi:CDGSH iron-sulfur domain-containing protein [Candidatus Bathyarchaeota archaeon]|nr:MAG: CDGSH iron-sulfur domain-containing protein [Candidatus Bathyarchaeota archaeon]TMI50303.1 MAG: CDGSH iron-sulfur domain-containing protein [Candidatus Bathyarchaeota archaeon]TMI55562.1 MAG: CDGSH iron-sulfur domain-containing protein [Candidatus Bathyarchaeota archaeon]
MSEVVIRSKENGPNLVMVDGKVVQAWCRCGGSSVMPFCDGMHKRNGFKAQPREVKVR